MNSTDPNSHQPPVSQPDADQPKPRAKWGRWGAVLFAISTAITVGGIMAAVTLIPKAIDRARLAREAENVPVRVEHETVARNSLVLGMTGIVCTIIALISYVFPFVGRHDVAAVLLASCVASFGLVTLIFKPFN